LQFVEAMDPGPVHLVGHDWGAVLTYAMLYRRPELFAASAAISVPHPLFIAHPKQFRLRQLQRSSYILLFQLGRLPEALARSSRVQLVARLWRRWSPGFVPPAALIEEIERCLQDSGSAPFAYYRNVFPSLRARAGNFGEITVPLLYVHGVEDGCIDAGYATGHEHHFTQGYQLALLPGVGHFIAAEAPRRLGQALEKWFQDPH
jgi:pimeloyl-ACP methyl ester carboxylesterase